MSDTHSVAHVSDEFLFPKRVHHAGRRCSVLAEARASKRRGDLDGSTTAVEMYIILYYIPVKTIYRKNNGCLMPIHKVNQTNDLHSSSCFLVDNYRRLCTFCSEYHIMIRTSLSHLVQCRVR